MPGRVDEVNPVAVPAAGHRRGEDGDPAVTLLGVEVGDGRAVMDFAALVGGSGDIQDPFGDGGLAGVDVGEDAQVADAAQRAVESMVRVSAHGTGPSRVIRARTARFPRRADFPMTARTRHAGQAGRTAGTGQKLVHQLRRRPRSRRRATGDTRITSYRDPRTAATARLRTAVLFVAARCGERQRVADQNGTELAAAAKPVFPRRRLYAAAAASWPACVIAGRSSWCPAPRGRATRTSWRAAFVAFSLGGTSSTSPPGSEVGCVVDDDVPRAGARWRVFVSHTSELREFPRGRSYVAAVERAVTACGHVIVDMADFPAADLPSARLCAERVDVVRCVRGGAGHPVRVAGAGPAGSVLHGAGVRGGDQGGAAAAGVHAGHRGRGDGHPAVGAN